VDFPYIQKVLQGKHFKEQTYNMCLGILRLAKAYSSARVDAACSRALRGTVYNYRNILNILNNNLDTLEYSDQAVLFTMPKHTNLRGPKAYQ
jgi:transposase